MIYLLVKETLNFLETGTHNMMLDLTDFTLFQQTVFDAVGSAVAKNPVSYFIPTHRVLPQNGIGICKSGAGFLRDKLLTLEGHDIEKLRGNYVCKRKKCCIE
jgi:hypothetical protein